MHHLLTLNAGSSSLKFALFEIGGDLSQPVEAGQVEGLGHGAGAATHEQALDDVLARIGPRHVAAPLPWPRPSTCPASTGCDSSPPISNSANFSDDEPALSVSR